MKIGTIVILRAFASIVIFALMIAAIATRSWAQDEELQSNERTIEHLYGGSEYSTTSFPVAYIQLPSSLCSGVPVASRFVLTARHCVRGKEESAKKGKIKIYIGQRWYSSKKIFTHKKYDIALIQTKTSISSSKAKISRWTKIPVGSPIFVAGFGESEHYYYGALNGGVLYVTLHQGAKFRARNIFAGTTPCSGDSGGPALVSDRGRVTVVGVVSTGDAGCPSGGNTTFINPGDPNIREYLLATIEEN